MARGRTFSQVSANVTASGGTGSLHITGLPSLINITKLKVVPSAGSGPSKVEVFMKDTLLSADRVAVWPAVSGNIYEPMDDSSGSPAEMTAADFVIVYEDLDATGELHIKFTNNDTVDKTYTVSGTYEETWIFDSSNVATAQKAELLGDVLYFGGRTSAQVSLRRSGNALLVRKGDDSADGQLVTGNIRSSTGNYQFVASDASNPLLKSSGATLQARLGDDSGYASLYVNELINNGPNVYIGGVTASDLRLIRSSAKLQVKLADASAFAPVEASTLAALSDVIYMGGTTSSHVSFRRSGVRFDVKLGDASDWADFSARIIGSTAGIINIGGATSAEVALYRSGTTLLARLADNSNYCDFACATISPTAIAGTPTLTIASGGNLNFSTYSPSTFDGTNSVSSSASTAQYGRIGNFVFVSGEFTCDPSVGSTVTSVGMSLPIASAFTQTYQCGGGGGSLEIAGDTFIQVSADVANDRALFRFKPVGTNAATYSYWFGYQIL